MILLYPLLTCDNMDMIRRMIKGIVKRDKEDVIERTVAKQNRTSHGQKPENSHW